MTSSHDTGEKDGVIRRAFFRSLAILAALALAGVAVNWYLEQQQPAPETVTEAVISGPVTTQETPAREPPAVVFRDITDEAGIAFRHVNGAYGEKLMPESIGSGAAFFDYDNDGDQDLLLINSSAFPGHENNDRPTPALYRNNGAGQFEEATREANLDFTLYGMGVAAGDYDNDGWTDLYITALGKNRLLHNEQGIFREKGEASGTAGLDSDWSTAAAFVDVDNDGDLDLFVGNYVEWTRDIDLEIDFRVTGLGRAIGAPNHFFGTSNRLYRNDGEGSFTDVSGPAGILVNDAATGAPVGKALAVAPVDYDGDGWIDLFVANDTTRNFLYHNLGDGRFEEIGALEGIAYDRNGKATGAMGIDTAWYRNDAELGIGIGNFANEMSSLFVTADGLPPFADEAVLEGFGPASRLALTFGLFFFDYDLDGRLDLLQANGHLESEINVVQPSQTYAQRPQLFWHCGDACRTRFIPVELTGDMTAPLVGRGAAYADIDNDGDPDFVITQNGRDAVLFRNERPPGHHWLRVTLEGTTANRDGIGAVVELSADGIKRRRQVMPTRSYLSQVELPVTFGLGDTSRVDSLRVTWPGGQVQDVRVDGIDRTVHVRQTGVQTP